jgi:CRISPR-associated protein Cmr6
VRLPLPLPAGVRPLRAGDYHRGLWYDKFCNQWDDDAWSMKAGGESSPKMKWIQEIAGTAGSPDVLLAYARRLFDLAEARRGDAVVVKARSRFVTGLGRSHAVENGFAWHPTLGTPYLPGSSVKGLIRAWASADRVDEAEVKRLLGDSQHAGVVIFLDAVPLGPVPLEADVLTPHYANWSVDKPPGDWRSPTPVPFLVAAPGWSMLCVIIPRRSASADDPSTVKEWLVSALDDAGAGAKTAVGYGHFQVDPHDSTLENWQQERQRRGAMTTPEGRWRATLEGRSEQEILDAVRTHLVSSPLPDPQERRALVRVVLGTGMVPVWRRGEKVDQRTNTGAKKLKGYARSVLDSAAELGLELPRAADVGG